MLSKAIQETAKQNSWWHQVPHISVSYILPMSEYPRPNLPGVNRQVWLRVQNEVGQRLTEFCQENELVTANTLFQ